MHDTGSFIDIAYQIGLHLCREAIWSDGRCNWLGASAERIFDRPYIVQRTFGSDIYGGTSGIALFLGHLYSYTRDAICKKTALAAMRQAVSATHKIENDFSLGLFTGVAGVAYVQLRLGILLEEPEWVSRGLVLLKQLPKDPTNIAYRDVVMGAAGAIAVLLAAGHRFQDASFIEEAQAFGEDLLRSACDTGKGWSWRTFGVLDGGQNLTGFSHGTSGIAWSLLELYNAVSDRRFLRAALEAFSYEGRLFDPSQRNWPDLRYAGSKNGDNARQMNFATAWCHGAPGIGLSRIVAIEVTADEKFKEQLRTALGTTSPTISQYAPDRDSLCLCHGAAGNAELLLEAAQTLKTPEYRQDAEAMGRRAAEYFYWKGFCWKSGVPNGAATPGFMLGLAGVGYFFLRLHDGLVPSMLLPRPSLILR